MQVTGYDMSRLQVGADERDAVESGARIVVEVAKQAGPDDEEPGLDADDIGEVIMKRFADVPAISRFISSGDGDAVPRIARNITRLASNIERVLVYEAAATDGSGVPPLMP